MIKKMMNLVGVALLLASTILSPASAVAQTLTNQSSALTTQSETKKGLENSSREEETAKQTTPSTDSTGTNDSSNQEKKAEMPASENKTEASADSSQVKEDTASKKTDNVEEKNESKPGAPPALTPRSEGSKYDLSSAANAKEWNDVITEMYVTNKDGNPIPPKGVQMWETFQVHVKFSLPNNTVNEGDTTTITLPETLRFPEWTDFEVKDSKDKVVAHAKINPTTKTITLTYTKYPSEHSDVLGELFFYAAVDHNKVKIEKDIDLDFKVGHKTKIGGKLHYQGPGKKIESILEKSAWQDGANKSLLQYALAINRKGIDLKEVNVQDRLDDDAKGIQIDQSSIRIYEVRWSWKNGEWKHDNEKDVTTNHQIKMDDDKRGFQTHLGNIGTKGYYIRYQVKTNYEPVGGEVFKNKAKLSSKDKILEEVNISLVYRAAGGFAEGYVYSMNLHKEDEKTKQALAGAKFKVTRDSNKKVIGEYTTDPNGDITIPNLLKDDYTIEEVEAPKGYQKSTEKIRVKPTDFGTDKAYRKTITNKKDEKVSAQLQVEKELIGRQLRDKEFTFELKKQGEQTPIQTKSNDADGKVQFKDIEYTKAGTYEYTISEKAGDVPGVEYEPNLISATVTVKDKGGKLEVTKVTYSKAGEETKKPTFENRYTPGKTFARLEVNKVLTGRQLQKDEFEFELTGKEDHIHQTKKNTAAGKVQFDTVEYTKAGEYHYTIKEKNNGLGGITYDSKEIKVTVKVTDDGKGKLNSEIFYENDDQTFKNTYSATKTNVQLSVKKALTGRKLKAQEFEFELKEDGKPDVLQTAKNDAQGKVQFQAINYDKAGEYHYTITEKNNGLTGVTYDSSKVKVTVKVTDDGKGKLSASVTYDGGKTTFKNTFTPKEITVPLQVTKALTGRNLQDDEFEFELYDGQNKLLQTVKNKADGTIPFTALKFTKAGLYNYLIKEKDGKIPGVDYDKQPIKVTIRVQQEEDGQLIYNIVYLGLDESGKNKISKQSFTNKYTAKGTDATFSVTKKLTGRALKDGEFSFDLKEDGKADVLQTKKNDKDGKVQFDAIKYQTVGTHKYTITEKNTGLGGVTYDTKTIKVTVEVTDNGKGQLVSKVTYENNDQTFTNTYSSQKVSAQLGVTKELTGRALNDQEFEFELVGSDDNVRQTKKNVADGRVTFDAIDYTKVGTYHYTIKEKDNGLGGVTYDKKEIKATVKVTDDGKGQLVAQVSYDTANPTFHNTYLAKETTAALEANKVLTGRELKENEFAFDLIGPDGKVVETVKNAKDGKISFKELTFKTAGTYTYSIKEQAGALGGVKYDTKVVKATVTVTDDGQGQLHATVAYENNQNTFTNTYSSDKATATLSAKKLLEGRNLKEGEFEFELTGTDDQVRQTKTNAQDGSVTFDTLEYTKVGTYHYTITEKDTKLGGVTYDKKVIKATVTVTDDGQGRLVTKVAYEKDDQTFKNTYSVAKTNAQLSVKKALTGRALKDGEFEFELKGQDDKVAQSKKNAQDGSVTFDTIEYTKAGTYHYTITEKDTKLQGITYDKKVIKVTVTVTDDGNGRLVAKVSHDKNIQTFENRYTPPKKDLPKTGTVIHTLAIFIGIIALIGAVYLIKKKS
ncbi:Spy0128 family protein [Streptococcus anginosus]|uniref:Spy0128 family protein n=1 Tax=Streptococcus anginosus TaxID=1328 RepID=UPI0018652F9A|nr:FctA domain-containing protein [Streptococcus anginosus]